MAKAVGFIAAGLASAYAATAFVGTAPSGAARLRASSQQASANQGAAGTGPTGLAVSSVAAMLAAAGFAASRRVARRATGAELAATIKRPEDNLNDPKFPAYSGGTGGYMSRATRQRHAITWTSKEEHLFMMPIGGWAIMNKGENLCYFRKKEQCIALGKDLRKFKIEDYKIYRLEKDGTVKFMHPADGVFPEKVKPGRVQVNGRPFTVAQNPCPGALIWTKYHKRSYEADPLTTLFIKARMEAFKDIENIFPLPQPDRLIPVDEMPEFERKMRESLKGAKAPSSL
jgi:photosystem I subunit II